VQADAVPLILGGGDVLAAAETGSGKTGAFALPVLQAVAEARAGVGASSALPSVAHAGGGGETKGEAAEDEGGGSASSSSSSVRVSTTDRDALLAVSSDGLRVQSRSERKWAGGRANAGVSLSGEKEKEEEGEKGNQVVFFEMTLRDEGLARVGWSSSSSFSPAAASLDLGTDSNGIGYGGTGKLVHGGRFLDFGSGFGKGDVVGCALDPRKKEISFYRNGELVVGGGGDGGDGCDSNASSISLPEGIRDVSALFPAVTLKNAEVELNFGGVEGGGDESEERKKPFAFPPEGKALVALSESPRLVRAAAASSPPAAPPPTTTSTAKELPLALVLEPLKDLAEQTAGVFESLSRYLPAPRVSTLLLVGGGGLPPAEAKAALRAGTVDVVVGTLGRVASAVEDGSLDLSGVRFFVLDEADRLVDALNSEALFALAAKLPARDRESGASSFGAARLQTLFFSATLQSLRVEAAAARLAPRALRVDLKGAGFVPLGVDHLCLRIDPRSDASWLQSHPRVPTDGVHVGSPAASLLASGAAAATALGGGGAKSGENDDEEQTTRKELLSLALKKLKARLFVRVADELRMPRAVVFCRSNHDCVQLARFLSSIGEGGAQDEALAAAFKEGEEGGGGGGGEVEGGGGGGGKKQKKHHHKPSPSTDFLFPSGPYSCAVLGGARTTDERREALQLFRERKIRFLVATDAAARGIDVAGLPYCVNFTLPSPDASEDYVHRIGRVGRAGAAGLAVSLVAAEGVEEKVWFVSRKGYKPWEARPPRALDRKAASEGGHTVWLDESESLRAVCERLQGPVQELGAGLELPEGVRERVEATARRAAAAEGEGGKGKGGEGKGGEGNELACYGSVVGDEGTSAAAKVIRERLEELAPAVKKLAELEEDAQTSFFELQTRWGKGGGSG